MKNIYFRKEGDGSTYNNEPPPSSEASDAPLDCYGSQGVQITLDWDAVDGKTLDW